MNFEGKVVAVTGAAAGIGRQAALLFARQGATVVLCDINADLLKAVEDEIKAAGGAAIAIGFDIADCSAVQVAFAQAVEKLGKIDALAHVAAINKVGPTSTGPLALVSPEDWHRVLQINVLGTLHCVQAVANYMIDHGGGRIVIVDSIVSIVPRLNDCAYGISKASARMLARCFALELAPNGIAVNCVAPGPTNTEMLRSATLSDAGLMRRMVEGDPTAFRLGIPLGHPGEPIDVASAIVFLASDEARQIAGAVLNVDGMAQLSALH